MQSQYAKSGWLSQYAAWVVRWRWLVILGAVMLGMLAGSGGRLIAFNNDYRVFFSDDNPQLQAFEELQRVYTKIDNIILAVAPASENAFDSDVLSAVEELTNRSWQLPYSLRVDSVTNFQHTTAVEDDLVVADLVEGAEALSASELQQKRQIALSEPFLAGQFLNDDASVIGINVTFQMPGESVDEAPIAVAAARELAADIESRYDVKVHLNGMVMMSNAFYETSMVDMGTLIPLMYLVIILISYFLLRSVSATIATFAVIISSIMTGMGLAGYLGIQLTPPSSAAVTIIMTLAVADSIHVLVTMLADMRKGMSKHDAIRDSLRVNFSPVFLTSVTTAIGFMSMNFSDSPPFHDLGNITAMGVMAALFFSLTLLPALMVVLPVKVKQRESKIAGRMENLADFVIRKQKPILILSIAASILILSFIQNNTMDDNFVGYFDESIQFRQDSDYINENLTGLYQLQYSLDSGRNNGVSDPEFLAKLQRFVDWLRVQPEVRHVNTISDTFKRLNKNLHGDDQAYYKLPDNPELAAQYLLLYELSLPYGLDLNNQLNISKSSTQVIVTLDNMSSARLREVAERGTQWLRDNADIESYGVGPGIMFAYISERNVKGMIIGTMVALVLISVLITLALRSFKLGTLSLIPNLLPAGLAFGIWGAAVGEVNMAVSMVTGMALGIVVDDTIHFLSKYLRARREKGLDAEQAVRYAFSTVGVAIIVTSVILVAGFLVLAQSSFGMNSKMAILTAIAIGVAVLADFLLLPALLLRMDGKSKAKPEDNSQDEEEESGYVAKVA